MRWFLFLLSYHKHSSIYYGTLGLHVGGRHEQISMNVDPLKFCWSWLTWLDFFAHKNVQGWTHLTHPPVKDSMQKQQHIIEPWKSYHILNKLLYEFHYFPSFTIFHSHQSFIIVLVEQTLLHDLQRCSTAPFENTQQPNLLPLCTCRTVVPPRSLAGGTPKIISISKVVSTHRTGTHP